MRGKPPFLPCSPQREGVRKVQVCGSLHPTVLLVGALGAKIWLPAPCGHGEGFVSMDIPHLTLGMEPLGTGAQERGPPQHFCCDGLPVLFPPQPTPGKPCLGVRTCCGMSKHGWQKQDLSCVPISISFLPRALGSGCPKRPTVPCHRAPCWGLGHHPCRVSSHQCLSP